MIDDVVFRLRLFARHPGLGGTAVLLLAVGLSTAGVGHDAFSAVVSPRIEGSDRLAKLGASPPVGLPGVGELPGGLLEPLRDATTSFSRVGAVVYRRGTLSDESGALAPVSRVRVARVSAGFFDLASSTPLVGRAFVAGDHEPGATATVILSHGLWERWTGRDPSMLRRMVILDDVPVVVIGVVPKGVRFPAADACRNPSEIGPCAF